MKALAAAVLIIAVLIGHMTFQSTPPGNSGRPHTIYPLAEITEDNIPEAVLFTPSDGLHAVTKRDVILADRTRTEIRCTARHCTDAPGPILPDDGTDRSADLRARPAALSLSAVEQAPLSVVQPEGAKVAGWSPDAEVLAFRPERYTIQFYALTPPQTTD